jgi:two-component system sensor histidine kinase FlrB
LLRAQGWYAAGVLIFESSPLPLVPNTPKPPSPQELEEAFSLFNRASAELADVYRELEQQVARLNGELAVANGELRRQYDEKEALSRRLSLLLDALPGGVIVLDARDVVLEANAAAVELLGGRIFNQPWSAIQAECLAATDSPQERRVRRVDSSPDAGSEPRWVSLSASQIDPAGGRVVLLSEVSEAYRMREELERHQKLSAMGEMAAGLAHQLRTPLATALLYAGNLTRERLADADRQRFAEKALARLKDLERMIQDMLTFLRGAPSKREPIALPDLIVEVAQVMEPQMADKQVRLTVAMRCPSVQLSGDRKRLCGALLNLLENALQASDPGTTVTLTADAERGGVSISVADEGKGMSAEVQRRLFQPFFTTRPEGTGLGLAIMRSVVHAHGGRVEVRSAPGQGSKFIVHLPAQLQTAEAAP